MRNIYEYTESNGLVVTKTDSKSKEDIDRLISLGKPQRIVDKFIELYLPTIDPEQIAADAWYAQHLLVESLDPNEERKQVPVLDENGDFTYVDDVLVTELGLNPYEVAVAARTNVESTNTWLTSLRGLESTIRPEYVIDVMSWRDDNVNYRTARYNEYLKLSSEGKFEHTVGDFLDALVKAHYGDTSELDALASKIAKIKNKHPNKKKKK